MLAAGVVGWLAVAAAVVLCPWAGVVVVVGLLHMAAMVAAGRVQQVGCWQIGDQAPHPICWGASAQLQLLVYGHEVVPAAGRAG